MIFGDLLHKEIDGFFSKFRTKQGILRSIRRKIQQEIREEEIAHREIQDAIDATKNQKEDALASALAKNGSALKQGYFHIKEDQMHRIFEALHLLLREDQKLFDQLKELEYALERDQLLKEEPKRAIAHAINTCILIVEKSAKRIIQDIEGMQSLTISAFKLLERESQMREVIGEILKERQPLRDFEKADAIALKQLQRLENPTTEDLQNLKIFDMDHNNHSIQAQMTLAIQELMVITDELIILLAEIYADFLKQWHGESGKGKRLAETSSELPSVQILGAPVQAGGFGLNNEIVGIINLICQHIDDDFKKELKIVEEEARLYLSEGEHMKLRE